MRLRGREIPLPFALGLAGLAVLAGLLVATGTGLVAVESLYFFLLGNTLVAVSSMALAALGGAFIGMLAGHHLNASQSFTPFERRVIEALKDADETSTRLQEIEDRIAGDLEELREDVERLREDVEAVLEDRQAP